MFSQACVKNSVHRGGAMHGAHTPEHARPPPRAHMSPGHAYLPGTHAPPPRRILRDAVNERAVHILLECNLVVFAFVENYLNVEWFGEFKTTCPVMKVGVGIMFREQWSGSVKLTSFPHEDSGRFDQKDVVIFLKIENILNFRITSKAFQVWID